MTPRTLIVLAAALVILGLLALFGQQRTAMETDRGRLLLPDLGSALDSVDSVSITGAGGETVATLERHEDTWTVAEKDGYPADVTKLREALTNLAEARVVEQKTSDPEYYERLGVQDIELETASGVAVTPWAGDTALPTVIVGDAASTGNHYVRLADEPTSYMIDQSLDVPLDATQWIDPAVIDVAGSRVSRVEIEHADGETLVVSKSEPSQSNFDVEQVPDGRELQYPGVANVIGNALSDLRLEDVAGATDASTGEGEAPVQVTYQTFDGLVVAIEGVERDDAAWIELSATVAADAAASEGATGDGGAAATENDTAASQGDAAATEGDAPRSEGDAANGETGSAADVQAEAGEINARVGGWRYRIPSYKFDQMTRHMDDLLKAEEAEEAAEE